MKVLVIFLCIAISHVVGELEGRDFAEENLRVKKEVSSFVSIGDNKTSATKIESLRENYEESRNFDETATDPEDANSIEMAFSKNPSPVIEISTAKPSSSKAIRNSLETLYLQKRTRNLNVLQSSDKNRSRTASDAGWNEFLKSVVRYAEALGRKRTDLASDDIRLRRRKRQVNVTDPESKSLSYKVFTKIRRKLPLPLRLKIRETQQAEDYLLDYYAGAGQSDDYRLREYNRTRFEELEELQKVVEKAGDGKKELIENYKAVRKGTPWNFNKLREKYKKFLAEPSPGLTEYLAMKYKEYSWIECFLNGTNVTKLAEAGPKYYAMDEERERRERAKEAETLSVEVVVDGGSAESIVATTDDVKVEAMNTATTTPPAQAKRSSSLVRIAVLFALVTQVIVVILILGPEISKLAEWCERRKAEDDIIASVEKEPLYRKKTLQLVTRGKSRNLLSTDW